MTAKKTAKDDSDRTVHATMKDGSEIVRYEEEGRWYQESESEKRPLVGVREAAELAASSEVKQVHSGLPGGESFDRKVAAQAQPAESEGDDEQ